MGGFAAAIPLALQAASTVAQHHQQRQAAKAQANQVSAQNELLAVQQQQREKQQRDLLARQMATARAKLSAGGVGLDSGSGQALLSGLTRQTEQDIADSAEQAQIRQDINSNSISSGAGLVQGLNTVQSLYGIAQKAQKIL